MQSKIFIKFTEGIFGIKESQKIVCRKKTSKYNSLSGFVKPNTIDRNEKQIFYFAGQTRTPEQLINNSLQWINKTN